MGKKIAWTLLATVVSSAAAAVGLRVADRIWRAIAKAPPPPSPRWARLFLGAPVKKAVASQLEPAP